jgi:hypothetical protein
MHLEQLDCILPSMPNNKLTDQFTAVHHQRHGHELVLSPLELEKLLLLLLQLLKRLLQPLQLLKLLQQRSLPRSVFHLQEVLPQPKHPQPLLPPPIPLLLRLLLPLLLLTGDK